MSDSKETADQVNELEVDRSIAPQDDMFVVGDESTYYAVGRSALACISVALRAAGKSRSQVRRILDLPCGYGRVMRYLRLAYPAAEITACDLCREGVDFCARTFAATGVYSAINPQEIPLPTDWFDLIWVGSLFTHFDADRWPAFLSRLRDSLTPTGVLVFTTGGRKVRQRIHDKVYDYELTGEQQEALLAAYQQTGFGYVEYQTVVGYGLSLTRPDWVVQCVLGVDGLRLVHFAEQQWIDHQDVVACVRGSFADPPSGSRAGNLERADTNMISGWAWNGEDMRSVKVDIYDGDQLLATIPADYHRTDGNLGFYYQTPDVLQDGKPHVIRVRIHGSDTELLGSPAILATGSPRALGDGHVDRVEPVMISGWAWDRENLAAVLVDIYDGDQLLATIPADHHRPDLKYKDGNFGFRYPTPEVLKDGKPHNIRVKIHGSDIELPGSNKVLQTSAAPGCLPGP